jgi:hypothetical protein
MASAHIKAEDPDLNDHIMYAKCIKGHALRDANDWILCENLPSPDAKCWQEGGDTLFSLKQRKHSEPQEGQTISPSSTDQSLPSSSLSKT